MGSVWDVGDTKGQTHNAYTVEHRWSPETEVGITCLDGTKGVEEIAQIQGAESG